MSQINGGGGMYGCDKIMAYLWRNNRAQYHYLMAMAYMEPSVTYIC